MCLCGPSEGSWEPLHPQRCLSHGEPGPPPALVAGEQSSVRVLLLGVCQEDHSLSQL